MILKTDIDFTVTYKVKRIIRRYDTNPESGGYKIEAVIKNIEGYPRKTGLPREMDAFGHFPSIMVGDTYSNTAHFQDGDSGYMIFLSGVPKPVLPAVASEVAKYLKEHVSGLGIKTATNIVDELGPSAITKISADPSCLDGIKNLTKKKKDDIAQWCQDNWFSESLVLALQQYDLPVYPANFLYDKYGYLAIQRLKDNPYSIYESGIIPFSYCETIAHKQNLPWNLESRLICAIRSVVDDQIDMHGDTCVFKEKIINLAEYKLRKSTNYIADRDIIQEGDDENLCRESSSYIFSPDRYEQAFDKLVNAGELVPVISYRGNMMYYRKSTYTQEIDASERIVKLLSRRPAITASEKQIRCFLQDSNMSLADEQADAIVNCVRHGISVLTGGPGTGKTFTVQAIVKTIKFFKPAAKIVQVAPTAKAAVRMQEMSHLPADTIHSAFKINMVHGKDMGNEDFVLDADYLIVDESSMISLEIFDKMLQKLGNNTSVLFVGDDAQLPSVDCGDVLKHLVIDYKFIPVSKLSQIHRQAGTSAIVKNAHIIRNGSISDINKISFNKYDFQMVEANNELKAVDEVITIVKKLVKRRVSLDDILILTPVHATGCGTDVLNTELQHLFNPVKKDAPSYVKNENTTFHVGDRVINTRNFTIKDKDGNKIKISNGAVGYITSLEDAAYIDVQLNNFDDVITFTTAKVEYLELAYAVTVHKSQGSEADHVILLCMDSYKHKHMLRKALVYTAVTRAKLNFYCVGNKNTFIEACKPKKLHYDSVKGDISDDTRVSLLASFIKEKAEANNISPKA